MTRRSLLLGIIIMVMSVNHSFTQTLVHYWNFNNSATITDLLSPGVSMVSGAGISHNAGGISAIQTTSNTGQGFDITNPNARNADVAGTHLRFNDPIGGGLVFSLPTNGFNAIVVKYATRRSGSGAGTQLVSYSIDGLNFIDFTTIEPVNGNPTLQTLDFSGIPEVNDNPYFCVRFLFEQGSGGTVGNNRFDNFTLEGSVGSNDLIPPTVTILPSQNSINQSVTVLPSMVFNEEIRLIDNSAITDANVDDLIEFRLQNESGPLVTFDATFSGMEITIVPATPLLSNQQYYLAMKPDVVEDLNDNAITLTNSTSFTTVAVQTVLQPGDLLPVAYRMNATATEDEIAFLSLVDILPGTLINFTDAKYTSNSTPQCAGGLIWTAPSSGISAGTVISIQTNAAVASIGTLSGSGFGLSSGGDQVLVYQGSANSPAYVTALSSNAWVALNTSCSGSLSQIPGGLTDGISSVNLSTAPASVSGNTVNAYYNGLMTGTNLQLKASILDPANWIGIGGATAPQTWPTWAFPGPPSVLSTTVLNAHTLRVVFNGNMDPVSSADITKYTGIAGLTSISLSNNGLGSDTALLIFSTSFSSGTNYSLQISGVKDFENRIMQGVYTYNFTYSTSIAWNKKYYTVGEGIGTLQLRLDMAFPSTANVDVVVKSSPFSTASADDYTFTTQTVSIADTSSTILYLTIPITDDNVSEDDEYLVLSLENLNGISLTGSKYVTIYIKDNDRLAPAPDHELELNYISSFDPSPLTGSTTEIVAYDPGSKRLFMTSAIQNRFDIADFTNPAAISLVTSVDMAPYGGITSVAVRNGIVAVASPNADELLNGSVVFFNTDGVFQKQLTVGALPDMITFSPDGSKIMTANEGQPNDAYTVDPEGSVSIIDISGGLSGLSQLNVTTLLFTDFNAQETTLINSGVRKLKQSSTLSQDLEPEYISISANSQKAWVTLQENNAIAEINLLNNTISSVWALGTKDFSLTGNGFDASDKSGTVLLSNFNIKSFLIPDGVGTYNCNGVNYIITANEGDEKEYSGLNERTTVGASSTILDPLIYPNAAVLKEEHMLGRLRMTNRNGDTDDDGDYDQIYVVGSRSFSIFNADSKSRVFDSGNDFESFTSTDPSISSIFNSDNADNSFKARSRAKGPEPEGMLVKEINGKTYAFIGLERIGGVMVYNITDPQHPVFVDYSNSRSLTTYSGDHGPEGIELIDAATSPDGRNYLVVANEISGTLSIYQIGIQGETGPSTAQSPFIKPVGSGREFTSILTVPETVNNYKMCGIPDGMGAFDNGDTTFTLVLNHEIGNTLGVARAHGSIGAFVSKWIIKKSDLSVVSGSDLIHNVNLWNGTSYTTYNSANPSSLAAFGRFCAADLPLVSAFYNSASGLGTQERIFMNGEETGNEGRAFAHIITGSNAGTTYELPCLGKFSWENSVASPASGVKTVVAGTDDVTGGQVYFYVGNKTNTGTEIEKAGLSGGKLYGVKVSGLSSEVNASIPSQETAFSLVDLGYVQNMTGAALQTASNTAGVTAFLRPEDGSWDPSSTNDFYFNTTNTFNDPSRLWRLHFTNVANPELGGTITAVLDGTEGQKMLDNITIDNYGHILLQEDPGNQEHIAKIWQYTIATDDLELAGEHDPGRFKSGGANFLTKDEESSGVIDVQSILGPGMFLLTSQAHYGIPGEAVEGGQIMAFFNPDTYSSYLEAHRISGTLSYDNIVNTKMNNSIVKLKQAGVILQETSTDALGHFSFSIVPEGNYSLEASTGKAWGGINSTDAQIILKQFTGAIHLSNFKLRGGEVNGNNYVNSSDALSVAKRFVNLVNSFQSGDWLFESADMLVNGINPTTIQLRALCYGDVDGSYNPVLKTEPSVNISEKGIQFVEEDQEFSIPVSIESTQEIGAISLIVSLPSSGMQIVGIDSKIGGTIIFNQQGNELRIAWFTDKAIVVNADDIVFSLKARINNTHFSKGGSWVVGNESSISDGNAITLNSITFNVPGLVKSTNGFSLGQNIPNPCNGSSLITYQLPVNGQVILKLYNTLGSEILILVNQYQESGTYTATLNADQIPSGIYYYKLELKGSKHQFTDVRRMIINR